MSEADAVALFRPRSLEKLKPFLDLDDESEESDGLYAESLDDGSVVVHTFQPYALFEESPSAAREWLSQFGEVLHEIHDDVRGLLFFPDEIEPEGRTYDAVVAEVEGDGVWIATMLDDDGADEDDLAALGFPPGALPPGVDVAQLQQLAGQLLGNGAKGGATSFDIGRLFQGMQQQLMDAFGAQTMTGEDDENTELQEGAARDPAPTDPTTKAPK